MKLGMIRNAVTSRVGRQILTAQKHSPVVLFGAGILGVVATAVLASRATLKLDDLLNEHNETMEKIKNAESIEEFDENDAQKARALLYVRTFGRIGKAYLPAVAIGIGSICALTGSHIILTRRNVALTAAYAAIDKGFQDYRRRVIEQYGEDKDFELRFGEFDKEVLETKDGAIEVRRLKAPTDASVYARIFDDSCPDWNNNAEYNRIFLTAQQSYFNNLLRARGFVTLNDVYRNLGFEETREGMIVGWVNGMGDDFIDFGFMSRTDSERTRMFINGGEPNVLLDFNVAGVIYSKIPSHR
jgi:hypothetical protein